MKYKKLLLVSLLVVLDNYDQPCLAQQKAARGWRNRINTLQENGYLLFKKEIPLVVH